MKIFTLIDCYLPGYKHGGPIRTLANMVEQLPPEYSFWIFTGDRDRGDQKPYLGVSIDSWNEVGRANVYYASPAARSVRNLLREIRAISPDVLYANGFFSRMTLRLLLARRFWLLPNQPIVLAPQGEFSPGALKLKAYKKRLFIALARWIGLFKQVAWRASTGIEASEIGAALGFSAIGHPGPRILVAPDPASVNARAGSGSRPEKRKGEARLVFVSRISPMKNLHIAIDWLRSLRGRVSLDIFGIIDDERYWKRCQRLLSSLPPNVKANYRGSLSHDQVHRTFGEYHFHILPTLGENFGHVVLESLSAGCPVIISENTPWRNLSEAGAGWDIPLSDRTGWLGALQAAVDMDPNEHTRMSTRALALAAKLSDTRRAVEQNARIFEEVRQQSPAATVER